MDEIPNSAKAGVHAAIALLVVGWIVVSLKLSVKAFKDARQWFLHDLYSILGLIFSTAEVIIVNINVSNGLGRHTDSFPKSPDTLFQLNVIYRMLPQGYVLYDLGLLFVKLSILSFYTNIFSISRKFKIIAHSLHGFTIAYFTAFILVDCFRCRPYSVMWNPLLETADFCVDGQAEQIALAVLNVLTDFAILLLPSLIIFKLQISRQKLIGLCVVFALGLFTCAAALARVIITCTTFVDSWDDGIWTAGFTVVWMNMEMLVGQICGGLFSMPALTRRVMERTSIGQSLQRFLSSGSGRNNTSTNGGRGFGPATKIPTNPGSSMTRSSGDDDIELARGTSTNVSAVPTTKVHI